MTAMAAVFSTLNPAQTAAVTHGEQRSSGGLDAGPLLVIAGAGTGKTSTLAHRVAHLLLQGVAPERTLLLTFSRRAALEMTRRAQRVMSDALASQAHGRAGVPGNLRLPWSGTFHAIGNRLVREHAAQARPRSGIQRARPWRCGRPRSTSCATGSATRAPKSASRARTPVSRSTRTASTRNGRCGTRSRRFIHGASSGRSNSPRCAGPMSKPSSSSRCSTTTTCCFTGT